MCRLKTCTHVKATSRMPAEVAAGFQPAGRPRLAWCLCRFFTCGIRGRVRFPCCCNPCTRSDRRVDRLRSRHDPHVVQRHVRDERRRCGGCDTCDFCHVPDPDFGSIVTRQIPSRQDEGANSCCHESITLVLPVANSLVFGQDDPPFGTYNAQPILVRSVAGKAVRVFLDDRTRRGQSSHEGFGFDAPVEKEDNLRLTPRGSRTGSLLRWHRCGGRNRRRCPESNHQPDDVRRSEPLAPPSRQGTVVRTGRGGR